MKTVQAEAEFPIQIALVQLHLEILVASPIRVVLLCLHLKVQTVSLVQVDSHAHLASYIELPPTFIFYLTSTVCPWGIFLVCRLSRNDLIN